MTPTGDWVHREAYAAAPLTLHDRAAGVLLHPTSLPGPHGAGDLGPEAHRFATLLAQAGQRWWQMLPVHPPGRGDSPYNTLSAFAGNPALIALEPLAEAGLLRHAELEGDAGPAANGADGTADFAAAWAWREPRLRKAFGRFRAGHAPGWAEELAAFREANADWLADYALFVALKGDQGGADWVDWPASLRRRDATALAGARERLAHEVAFREFLQFCFERQWQALAQACEARGIGLMGDVPIFVAHDSAEVWAHPELFHLEADGHASVVAGVPPDAYSDIGQKWGNPLYRWDAHRTSGYAWWTRRLRTTLRRFHAVRLDHFIGFTRYWEVPAEAPDARTGHFQPGPKADFLEHVRTELGRLPLVAEDLGIVTEEVVALREAFDIPGMRVLQFAFGDGSENIHLPHNHTRRSVVYTATHDHDTSQGWFHGTGQTGNGPGGARLKEREHLLRYLGTTDAAEIHWQLIRLALISVADTAIVPVQDLLGLDSRARMNMPGTASGNWSWRLRPGALTDAHTTRLGELSRLYGRTA